MTGNLCFASPRTDLEQLIGEASLLLQRPDVDLAPLAEQIANVYEAVRDMARA